MRSDLAFGGFIQAITYGVALATDQPEFLTKVLGILAGCSIGAMIAAAISEQPTASQRVRRFVAAFGSGVLVSVVMLWIWPGRIGIDPREFVFAVSGVASCFAWRFVAKADGRADRVAERVVEELEERAGAAIDKAIGKRERDAGRIRLVPLVLLVLLGALAALVWVMFTTQVH